MQLRLLGGFQVLSEGSDCKFNAPSKAVALLAYLLLHRSQNVRRDAVAFALWPDDNELRARANLRRHIALLRQALPKSDEPVLIADQHHIRWNRLYDESVDVCRFERYSAARDEGTAQAVNLYRGDLLPGLYEEWLLPHRERLRDLQGKNLEHSSRRARQAGDYPGAIATAKRLLEHDPWREDTVRYLMSLRYDSGDRAGALQEYERLAARLRAEMQVLPMPETRARNDAIVRNEAAGTPSEAPDPAAAPSAMPFVGRSAEIERLSECWSRAMRGYGRIAFLTGEAGIGKTRLASEFAHVVESQGGRVAFGSTAFAEAVPYQAIVEALRFALPMLASLHLKPVHAAAASSVLPELLQTYKNLPQLSPLEPQREQARLFEAMWVCLEGIARIRPLLVVLEDLHWAGHATTAFLNYIGSRVSSIPMIVLVTHRESDLDVSHPLRAFRRSMQSENRALCVPLAELALTDVEQFIERSPSVAHIAGFAARARAKRGQSLFSFGAGSRIDRLGRRGAGVAAKLAAGRRLAHRAPLERRTGRSGSRGDGRRGVQCGNRRASRWLQRTRRRTMHKRNARSSHGARLGAQRYRSAVRFCLLASLDAEPRV